MTTRFCIGSASSDRPGLGERSPQGRLLGQGSIPFQATLVLTRNPVRSTLGLNEAARTACPWTFHRQATVVAGKGASRIEI